MEHYKSSPHYLVMDGRVLSAGVIDGYLILGLTEDRSKAVKLPPESATILSTGMPGSLVLTQQQFANFKLKPC